MPRIFTKIQWEPVVKPQWGGETSPPGYPDTKMHVRSIGNFGVAQIGKREERESGRLDMSSEHYECGVCGRRRFLDYDEEME